MSKLCIDIDKITELYHKGFSTIKIGKELNVSWLTIRNRLLDNNIILRTPDMNNRKSSIDPNYFEKIDNEFKTYFLGFLYADGCVNRNSVKICLSEKDKYILNTFNEILTQGKTHLVERKENFHMIGDKEYIQRKSFTFTITNAKIKNDIIKLGCIPRKSLVLKFPTFNQVPEHLMNHFIRGYFDGDGCIYQGKRGKYTRQIAFIVSSIDFCKEFGQYLKKLDIRNSFKFYKKGATIHIIDKLSLLKFYNFIYNKSNYYLIRKKNNFNLDFLNKFSKGEMIDCVIIDNKKYRCLYDASQQLNIDYGVLKRRCLSDKFINYQLIKRIL